MHIDHLHRKMLFSQHSHYKLPIHIFLFSIFVVPHGLVTNDKLQGRLCNGLKFLSLPSHFSTGPFWRSACPYEPGNSICDQDVDRTYLSICGQDSFERPKNALISLSREEEESMWKKVPGIAPTHRQLFFYATLQLVSSAWILPYCKTCSGPVEKMTVFGTKLERLLMR